MIQEASVREATLSEGQLTEIHRDPKQGDTSLAMYYLKYKVLTLHIYIYSIYTHTHAQKY